MKKYLFFIFISILFLSAQSPKTLYNDLSPVGLQVMPEMLTALKQNKDPWFSEDKFYHLSLSAAFSSLGYHLYTDYCDGNENNAKIYAITSTACIGICKELYDKKKKNHFSWKDLFWDGIGLTLGYLLFID